jgi:hypothetical protein
MLGLVHLNAVYTGWRRGSVPQLLMGCEHLVSSHLFLLELAGLPSCGG